MRLMPRVPPEPHAPAPPRQLSFWPEWEDQVPFWPAPDPGTLRPIRHEPPQDADVES